MKFGWMKIMYLLGSLIMAILLSIYATGRSETWGTRSGSQQSNQTVSIPSFSNNHTETISMPVQISGIDTDKYIIDGVPNTVNVRVTGPTALVTAAKNTKNFTVSINLSSLTDGKHTLPLRVQGLNQNLTYHLSENNLDVSIYRRATAYFTVQTNYNTDAIAEGYHVGTVSTTVTNVEVMGRSSLVNSVSQVVANVQLPRNTKTSTSHTVELQALDENGDPVAVTMSPQTTTVRIPITAGSGTKNVPVHFQASNGNADDFDITANVNEVALHGKVSDLNNISRINIPVNLDGITSPVERQVTVTKPNGVDSIDPAQITVTISPKE